MKKGVEILLAKKVLPSGAHYSFLGGYAKLMTLSRHLNLRRLLLVALADERVHSHFYWLKMVIEVPTGATTTRLACLGMVAIVVVVNL